MNNTTAIIGGVVAVVLVGGIIFYSMGAVNPFSTQTPSTTDVTNTGTTGQTTSSSPTQTPGAPAAVTNATVVYSDTTAVVVGTVTPNGAFASYWYEYGTTGNLGNKTENQSIGSGYASIPAPGYILGLAKDTSYYFRLVAQNQYGTATGLQYTFHTTVGTPPPVGSAPTIQTSAANGITRTTATVNGEVLPNRASTTYWFEYGKTTNLGAVTTLQSVGNGTATLPASAVLLGLDPTTTYYFRIDAQNQFGTRNGTILTFKTTGPATVAPATPSVTTGSADKLTSSGATLHGTVVPNGADTKYWFEYGTDSLFGLALLRTTSHVSAGAGTVVVPIDTAITNLKTKTTYYFRIVAQNNLGITKGGSASFKTK
ncbi:MAG: hypothetical protein Q7S26_04230 [bacterium]|nr:hypothetical protein [bacterium]